MAYSRAIRGKPSGSEGLAATREFLTRTSVLPRFRRPALRAGRRKRGKTERGISRERRVVSNPALRLGQAQRGRD